MFWNIISQKEHPVRFYVSRTQMGDGWLNLQARLAIKDYRNNRAVRVLGRCPHCPLDKVAPYIAIK
jgi:hypothetical protein